MSRATSTPGKMPEILTSLSLGEWFAAKLEEWIERDKAEAADADLSRVARVELDNAERVAAQIKAYHAASAS